MALRTLRRLTAVIISLLSMGLLITSLVLDEWYSTEHLVGEKGEGELWQEYLLDYGIYDFEYVKLWSDIFGENHRTGSAQMQEDLEELGDYTATSIVILIIIHILFVFLGFLAAIEKINTTIPILMALIILMGSIFVIINYQISMENLVTKHIYSGLYPLDEDLDKDVKKNLSDSGDFGSSFFGLIPVPVISLIMIIILIDPKRDRYPSAYRLKEKFYR